MITRRQFTTALAGASVALAQRPAARQPNIVFILADDLGYGDLSCYGQKQFSTPNIDALAKEGVRFTQAYSGSTVCAPSRCALMTGLHTGHCRVRGNKSPEVPLQPEDVTVAELLKKAGYRTGLFGKWGLGYTGTPGIPNKKGFDDFFGYHTQIQAHTYYPHQLYDNGSDYTIAANFGTKSRKYAPDLITERALKFIDDNRQRPFFLYLPYTSPHANNELGRDTGDGMEVPEWGEHSGKSWPNPEKGFAAMIGRLDRDIGRVLAKLREHDLDQNTVVVFTSDNGPHQEGGHDDKFFNSSGPLRGIKRDLYEGGIRVPFLVKWPGVVKPSTVSDRPVAFWDVLPTLADIGGGASPSGIDGVSIVPTLRGENVTAPRVFYWEFHEGGFNRAVRFGDWKAVQFGAEGEVELYDLAKDPGEKTNLAQSKPDVLATAKSHLQKARTESKDFPVQAGIARSPNRGFRIQ